jgi:hypothetical protein
MKKIRIYNYPDNTGTPCIWIGTVVSGSGPESIVKMKNSKGEIKEDFLANLQIG